MNINAVRVRKLFGLFNHSVQLRKRERITIVHGPNGVGKTTVLRMLKSLCSFDFHGLSKFHFSEFEIDFDDGQSLKVTRKGRDAPEPPELTFRLLRSDKTLVEDYVFEHAATDAMDDLSVRSLVGVPIGAIEDIVPELDQVGPRAWRVISTGEVIDLDAVLSSYGDRLPLRHNVIAKSYPKFLREKLAVNKVYLIETQRLSAKSVQRQRPRTSHERWSATTESSESLAVEEIARDMASQISNALQISARVAAKLDAQFAYKLLTGSVSEVDEGQIRERYSEYKERNRKLVEAGIFEHQYVYDLPSKLLESGDKRVLSLYLKDVDEKLRPFNELLVKVLLFVNLINGRFKNKQISADKEKGLKFTASSGGELRGSNLSSGEQHELILMYTLLFKVQSGSLIAIDEPELSLHVTWQQKFLDDLRSMSEAADLDFLVATHSPSIINGRLDLAVELE